MIAALSDFVAGLADELAAAAAATGTVIEITTASTVKERGRAAMQRA